MKKETGWKLLIAVLLLAVVVVWFCAVKLVPLQGAGWVERSWCIKWDDARPCDLSDIEEGVCYYDCANLTRLKAEQGVVEQDDWLATCVQEKKKCIQKITTFCNKDFVEECRGYEE